MPRRAEVTACAAAAAEVRAARAPVALPVRSCTRGSRVTEPVSGRARPCGSAGFTAYGKLPSWTVRVASGSLRIRKDSQTSVPLATPYFDWAASRESALFTSPPPPEPNRAPMTVASATRSVGVKCSMVPALVTESLWPVRTYSPGKVRALSEASM
ncbi:hypothetical protein SGLAM104S_03624 [Streptomyces glaucescens]